MRYDYLMDKLAKEFSESNGVFTIKLPPGANTNIIADLEKHNRWSLHQMTNQDSGNVLAAYLNALAHAYDPHSDYMSAPRAQDFSISMNLALFGIGAQLTEDDGYCTIHSLVPGGPASKSKVINEKDRIRGRGAGQQAAGGRGGHGSGKSRPANSRAERHRSAADHQSGPEFHHAARSSRSSATKSSSKIRKPRPSSLSCPTITAAPTASAFSTCRRFMRRWISGNGRATPKYHFRGCGQAAEEAQAGARLGPHC